MMRRLALLLSLGAALGGCLSPMSADDAEIAAIRVTFGSADRARDTIQVRGTTRVIAVAVAREGYDVGATDFTFTSSDTTIAVVDESGTVRGVAPGTATITASRRGLEGRAEITVVPSTVAYTVAAGSRPSAIAFSTDYTRAYVVVADDSLAVLDAINHFRLRTVGLGLRAGGVAATSGAVYVTHPLADSVSVVSPATGTVQSRIFAGAGPDAIVATAQRAFVAARYDRRIVIIENGAVTLGIPVGGEPRSLALSRDGARLFATVQREAGWRLVSIAPQFPDTLASAALPSAPVAVATNADGSRAYVLLGGSAPRVLAFAVGTDGALVPDGELAASAGASGIAARPAGDPLVVVSGEPLVIVNGQTMGSAERIAGVGSGPVAVRPDGIFAFVLDPANGLVKVVGL